MGEWVRLSNRVGVRYLRTEPDHWRREHDINVGFDGVYLTNTEALSFAYQLPEVRALVEWALSVRREYNADTATMDWPIADEYAAWVNEGAGRVLRPFQEADGE